MRTGGAICRRCWPCTATVLLISALAGCAGTGWAELVPLSRNDFFGPMAVAIMGGLIFATALTLLFLPALYAAWYTVKPAQA